MFGGGIWNVKDCRLNANPFNNYEDTKRSADFHALIKPSKIEASGRGFIMLRSDCIFTFHIITIINLIA